MPARFAAVAGSALSNLEFDFDSFRLRYSVDGIEGGW